MNDHDTIIVKQALADMEKIINGLRRDIEERGGVPINRRSSILLGCLCSLLAAGTIGDPDLTEAFEALTIVAKRALARHTGGF